MSRWSPEAACGVRKSNPSAVGHATPPVATSLHMMKNTADWPGDKSWGPPGPPRSPKLYGISCGAAVRLASTVPFPCCWGPKSDTNGLVCIWHFTLLVSVTTNRCTCFPAAPFAVEGVTLTCDVPHEATPTPAGFSDWVVDVGETGAVLVVVAFVVGVPFGWLFALGVPLEHAGGPGWSVFRRYPPYACSSSSTWRRPPRKTPRRTAGAGS